VRSISQIALVALLIVLPGVAFLRLVGVRLGYASELSLAIAISLAFNGIAAGIALYAGVWDPERVAWSMGGLTVACGAFALLKRRRGPPEPAREETASEGDAGQQGEGLVASVREIDAERARLREDVERLENELSGYREVIERLETELARYRAPHGPSERREVGTTARIPDIDDDVRRESQAILERARARLISTRENAARSGRTGDSSGPRDDS
jgi:hypothetical protein